MNTMENIEIKEEEENDDLDPELLKAIYEANMKKIESNDFFVPKAKPESKLKVKVCKEKPKNILTLNEFSKKMEEEVKNNMPKKFISKRADTKRKELGIEEEKEPKRSFNPRKPPYNFVFNKTYNMNEVDVNNTEEFPTLN
jgi:hypothetical protein